MFDGVRIIGGIADLTMSSRGDVLYISGPTTAADAYEDCVGYTRRQSNARRFRVEALPGPGTKSAGLALSPDGTRLAVNIQGQQSGDIWIKQSSTKDR